MSKNIKDMNNKEFIGLDANNKILLYSSEYEVPHLKTREEALLHLKSKIADKNYQVDIKESNKTFKLIPLLVKVAAGIIILLGAWYLWVREPYVDVVSNKGQQTEYQLPDGTIVSMNADSKVTFKKDHFVKKRIVTMEGEVFFNVVKGNTFKINTKTADIEILGTSFNLFARETTFKVTCFTGKIRVSNNKSSVVILPGESAEIKNNSLVKFFERNIQTIGNWRNGEFYFENTSLTKVFKEIERQFNVNFVSPDLSKKFFTGSFTNKNLVSTLDIVCIPMGLTYEIGSNSKIFIREKLH